MLVGNLTQLWVKMVSKRDVDGEKWWAKKVLKWVCYWIEKRVKRVLKEDSSLV